MKIGDRHAAIIVDRPPGDIVNLAVGANSIMAFRILRKVATVEMFPGGHGKGEYELECVKTSPMTKLEIARHLAEEVSDG